MENFEHWRRIETVDQLALQHSVPTKYSALPKEYFIEDSKVFFTYGAGNASDIYITPVRPEAVELLELAGYEKVTVPYREDRFSSYLEEDDKERFSYLEVEANLQNRNRASCIAFGYACSKRVLNVKLPNTACYKVVQISGTEAIGGKMYKEMLQVSSETGEVVSETLSNVGKYFVDRIHDDDYLLVMCDNVGNTYAIRGDLEDIMNFEYKLIYSGFVSLDRVKVN